MKINDNFWRILGILFFSYRAYIAYHRIDLQSGEASIYSYAFYVWLMVIFIIIVEWIFYPFDNNKDIEPTKKKTNKEKEYLQKIQEEYEKQFVSKTP
jgi:hypothetical protein